MSDVLETCLEYALRVSLLHDDIRLRPSQVPNEDSPTAAVARPADPAPRWLDFGSLVGRDAAKSPRLSDKVVKNLDNALQRVAMGKDPRYQDQRFRRMVAAFLKSEWDNFQHSSKDSRKAENLIMFFMRASVSSLQKEQDLADGEWKQELEVKMRMFISFLIDAAPQELKGTLLRIQSLQDTYDRPAPSAPLPAVQINTSASDGQESLSAVVQELLMFGADNEQLQSTESAFRERRDALRSLCTIEAAVDDLKLLLQRLSTDHPTPYTPADFELPSHWAAFRARELQELSEATTFLLKLGARRDHARDRSDLAVAGMQGLHLDEHLTFVPAAPREAYKSLLRRCLDYDLAVYATLPTDAHVSLGILSTAHLSLLQECAERWRIPTSSRAVLFLEALHEDLVKGHVPAECLFEALEGVEKVDIPCHEWAIQDRHDRLMVLGQLRSLILGEVLQVLTPEDGPDGSSFVGDDLFNVDFQVAVAHWQVARRLVTESDETELRVLNEVRSLLQQRAIASWSEEAVRHQVQDEVYFRDMAAWIIRVAQRSKRRNLHKDIVFGFNIVDIVFAQHRALWIQDLAAAMTQPVPTVHVDFLESVEIYHTARGLHTEPPAGVTPVKFVASELFEPQVNAWIESTAQNMQRWADNALQQDDFSPTSPNGPSSSVGGLFDVYNRAYSFLSSLEWDDQDQLIQFLTGLSKAISESIGDYCVKLEQRFIDDINESKAQAPTPLQAASQEAWIEKAKKTIAHLQGDKKLQPFFNFSSASCVKLNNIDVARRRLDELYETMAVDKLAVDVNEPIATQARSQRQPQSLFTIKILQGEGLAEHKARAPDTYVVLSRSTGAVCGRTRRVYEDRNPRWEHAIDIPVHGVEWLKITVRDANAPGGSAVEPLGWHYLELNPAEYAEASSVDKQLALDPTADRGRILLRISKEGERNDIRFHFGRAFRSLKRSETSMVQIVVDQMTPVLRHTLSRSAIQSVLKPSGNDALRISGDAIGRISAAYRNLAASAQGNYTIPLPLSEQKRTAPTSGPSDAQIESAIYPLFDYLDTNNRTLASTLSPDAVQMVMARLWKQILATIENLIVPPLGAKRSNMEPLTDRQLVIALQWLQFLKNYFHAGGHGVPLATLQNAKYNELVSTLHYSNFDTDDLMEECVKGLQSTLKAKASRPSKSILGQRNLGTIKARKTAKRSAPQGGHHEIIMKLLRMRPGTEDFLAQQIQTLHDAERGSSITRRRV